MTIQEEIIAHAKSEIEWHQKTLERLGYGSISSPCSERTNANLRNFTQFWKLDGDILRCRKCKRGIISSRSHEDMAHADECEARLQSRPWDQLRRIIPTQNSQEQEPR